MKIEEIKTLAFLDFPADMACEKLLQYEGTHVDAFITANSNKPFMLGWYGGGRNEFREYEGEIAKLVRRKPDIKLILKVGSDSGAAPLRWCQEHADQLAKHADGVVLTAPSLASDLWREESAAAIARLVAHLEAGPYAENIVGYLPVFHSPEWRGVGECISELPVHEIDVSGSRGDFSKPMVDGFRVWLKAKYGDGDFDAVLPPSLEERDHADQSLNALPYDRWGARFSDYFEYYNSLNARLALEWCRAVKRGCDGKKAVGLFFGQTFGFSKEIRFPQGSGHALPLDLFDAPEVDFFGMPFSHVNRSLAGTHDSPVPIQSIAARGKTFFDVVESGTHIRLTTHREVVLMMGDNTQDFSAKDKRWEAANQWETDQILARDAAFGLVRPHTRIAWMEERCPLHGHWFTHHEWGPLQYDTPEIKARLAQLNTLLQSSGGGSSVAQIAVFTSARSCLYRPLNNRHLEEWLHPFREKLLAELAAPFDDYLLEDWELAHQDGRGYRAYLFLDALYIPSRLRLRIREKLEHPGTFALWLGTAGGYDENGPTDEFAPGLKSLPAFEELRACLAASGVHLYSDCGDLVLVNDRMLALTAKSDGPRRLHLPEAGTLRDALTGETFGPAAGIELNLKRFETRIFERN